MVLEIELQKILVCLGGNFGQWNGTSNKKQFDHDKEDEWVWKDVSLGNYTVKFAYGILSNGTGIWGLYQTWVFG